MCCVPWSSGLDISDEMYDDMLWSFAVVLARGVPSKWNNPFPELLALYIVFYSLYGVKIIQFLKWK
jgi:hypothetical protein